MPKGVYKHKRGYKRTPFSQEWCDKISKSNKGCISWNKGLTKETDKRVLNYSKALIGIKNSAEAKQKMSLAKKGKQYLLGFKFSDESKLKMRLAQLGTKKPWVSEMMKAKTGENHPNWIKNRTQLKKRDERNDSAYFAWNREIKKRDGKCRLENENCNGYLIVHHILGWTEYPAERYNINNGITLCQAHHPRKRAEEKRFEPILQRLVINDTLI